jgi:hypothetical protein
MAKRKNSPTFSAALLGINAANLLVSAAISNIERTMRASGMTIPPDPRETPISSHQERPGRTPRNRVGDPMGTNGDLIATRCLSCDTHWQGTGTTCPTCGSGDVQIANIIQLD